MLILTHRAGFGAGQAAVSNDPYYASVTLLATYEVDFTDAKGNAETTSGSPTIVSSTPSPPAGASNSAKFVAASSQYVHYGNSSDFNTGTGDFTAEAFFNIASAGSYRSIISKGNAIGGTANTWGIYTSAGNQIFGEVNGNTVNIFGGSVSLSTWYHCALVRESGTWALYFNGTRIGTSTSEGSSDNGSTNNLYVGSANGSAHFMNGNVAYARITKGVARYSGATYTPPTIPTSY